MKNLYVLFCLRANGAQPSCMAGSRGSPETIYKSKVGSKGRKEIIGTSEESGKNTVVLDT